MRLLYLIRHATPLIQPQEPTWLWPLSERGIDEAHRLADVAAAWRLRALYTSNERKAEATALIIGEHVGLPAMAVEGCEELRFGTWINNADEFSEAVRTILEEPGQSLRGAERADAAAARFASATQIMAQGEFPAAVVSHGRILAAFLGARLAVDDPFALWRSMPMPGWAVLDLDQPKLVEEFRGLA